MAPVERSMDYPVPAAVAEALWYDQRRWPSWVDGLARVVSVQGDWPHPGALLVWESTPHGRGRVTERVLWQERGAGQELEVSDERLEARQRVGFERLQGGVGVRLALDYRLRSAGPLGAIVDALFVRRALGDSLRRTLEGFGRELAEEHPPG